MRQYKGHEHDEYVASLLTRITELEDQRTTAPTRAQSTTSPLTLNPTVGQISCSQAGSPVSAQISQSHAQTSMTNASPVDAMGADTASHTEQHQVRYYGGSSATSLMRQIYQAIGHLPEDSRTTSPLPSVRQQDFMHQDDFGWTASSVEHFSLLPRPLTDGLLDVYWNKVHHLYPFIHKQTFMSAYERLWMADATSESNNHAEVAILGSTLYGHSSYVFHCALNIMLALAIQLTDTPPGDRAKLADIFSVKARNLCKLDLFDDGSLACIQTLLLMTLQLQSTPFPNRCWNCIGIACRLAQGLALHIESSKPVGQISLLELEMRRRVWHGCVFLDTIVSTTLGRPMMLHKFTPSPLPLPSPIDDEFLATSQLQPSGKISYVSFYIESLKLYNLLADIVAKVYGKTNLHPSANEKRAGIEEISKFDTAISNLENGLPDHLQHDGMVSNESAGQILCFRRQAYVLQARFLHLRLLLYRPTFLRFWHQQLLKQIPSSSSRSSRDSVSKVTLALDQSISVACVEASLKLVDVIAQSTSNTASGAWWYSLLYIRLAGTVVVLAMCCDAVVSLTGLESLHVAYQKSLSVLEGLTSYSSSVSRAIQQLRRMHEFLLNPSRGLNDHGLTVNNNQPHLSNLADSLDQIPDTGRSTDMVFEQQDNLFPSDTAIFEEMFGQDAENWMMKNFGLMPV